MGIKQAQPGCPAFVNTFHNAMSRIKPPTGAYLGVVHFQRLLREPPSMELGRCLEQEPAVPPSLSDREVAERLASYNLLAMPVCDQAGRLLGAITVDDVLDRTLPAGWRQRRRHPTMVT